MVGIHSWIDESLEKKVAIPLLIATLVVAGAAAYVAFNVQVSSVEDQAVDQAESVVEQMKSTRGAYTESVVGKLGQDNASVEASVDFASQKDEIPLPATFVHLISDRVNQKGLYHIDLISPWPINPEQAPDTAWEKRAIEELKQNPDRAQHTIIEEGGETKLLYMSADTAVADACVTCHNNHPESPRTDFERGDMMGALVVEIPVTGAFAAAQQRAMMLSGGLLVALLALAAAILYVQRRLVIRPVSQLTAASESVAEQDLTTTVPTIDRNDEIGTLNAAFRTMVTNIEEMVRRMSQNSATVASSAEELAAANEETNAASEEVATMVEDINDAAAEQAGEAQEANRSLRDLAEKAEDISRNSDTAADVATEGRKKAESGGEAANEAMKNMEEIQQVVDRSADEVQDLGQKSDEIGRIVDVITEMAEQTNLLALNAAIEAARAGEQGKGFAVVAEEIRTLAEESAEAASQISDLIADIQDQTDSAVASMEVGTDRVDESTDVVEEALSDLEEIAGSVMDVSSKVQDVSRSAEEQTDMVEDVVGSMDTISDMAEETADNTEDVSAAAEEQTASMQQVSSSAQELSGIAESMQSLVDEFEYEEKD